MVDHKILVGVILFFALAIRLIAAWSWHQSTIDSGRLFRLGDSDSYWVLAGHIARGEAYEYGSSNASVFRAPVYPLFLAPFTLVASPAHGVAWARVFGCLCGTLCVGLVMILADRLGNRRATLLSGCVAALYPGAIGMSIAILSEAVFCPLMLLTLMLWHTAMNVPLQQLPSMRATLVSSLFAGGACGLAILARPSWLLFMPAAGLCVLLFHPLRRHQWGVLVLMGLGCAAVMTPWWIRNYAVTSRFVPTTLQVGASLYDGLHANASGASDENMEFVNRFVAEQQSVDEAMGIAQQSSEDGREWKDAQEDRRRFSTFEYRVNARMQAAAVDWARKNVSGAFRLGLVKFGRTWSVWPRAGEVGSTALRASLLVGCLGVLACAVWTSWYQWLGRTTVRHDGKWLIVVCWLPAAYFTFLHTIFVGSIRYREPAMLVLTILAGSALSCLPIFQRETWKSSIEKAANS